MSERRPIHHYYDTGEPIEGDCLKAVKRCDAFVAYCLECFKKEGVKTGGEMFERTMGIALSSTAMGVFGVNIDDLLIFFCYQMERSIRALPQEDQDVKRKQILRLINDARFVDVSANGIFTFETDGKVN